MPTERFILFAALGLVAVRWAGQCVLARLNRGHVRRHAVAPPEAVRGIMDASTYRRSTDYTLAKSLFGQVEEAWGVAVLVAVLVSGALPASLAAWRGMAGGGVWASAAWLLCVGVALALPGLPLDWWSQFRLEERFGFNRSTLRTWVLDRAKMLLLSAAIGLPLLALVLRLVTWMGPLWWLWAWAAVMAFQLLMLVLAPLLILPLFNKFTPLPEGTLRDRLLALGERTGFTARTIQVVDGSRRSGHSNAYFTGFGRFRKIVLYDTLLAQLGEDELEAVLAHEIGHHRRGHIPKMMAWSAASMVAAFACIGWMAARPEFLRAFGFPADAGLAPVLLLFGLLGGAVTFWLTPVGNALSRRHEYQADAYARSAMGGPAPLIGALRKLHEKNLANLTPHPIFGAFYYSHPTLVEREAALARG